MWLNKHLESLLVLLVPFSFSGMLCKSWSICSRYFCFCAWSGFGLILKNYRQGSSSFLIAVLNKTHRQLRLLQKMLSLSTNSLPQPYAARKCYNSPARIWLRRRLLFCADWLLLSHVQCKTTACGGSCFLFGCYKLIHTVEVPVFTIKIKTLMWHLLQVVPRARAMAALPWICHSKLVRFVSSINAILSFGLSFYPMQLL